MISYRMIDIINDIIVIVVVVDVAKIIYNNRSFLLSIIKNPYAFHVWLRNDPDLKDIVYYLYFHFTVMALILKGVWDMGYFKLIFHLMQEGIILNPYWVLFTIVVVKLTHYYNPSYAQFISNKLYKVHLRLLANPRVGKRAYVHYIAWVLALFGLINLIIVNVYADYINLLLDLYS